MSLKLHFNLSRHSEDSMDAVDGGYDIVLFLFIKKSSS